MNSDDIDEAISAALSLDWNKALEINQKILARSPNDMDCLNRIGKCYLELGDYKKAAIAFKGVLKLNKYDPIATRNLSRITQGPGPKKGTVQSKNLPNNNHVLVSFLEEPGKTKIVSLVNLAPIGTLLSLANADNIQLVPKRHTVLVENNQGTYIGALPDDLAHRLLILIKGGNKYDGFVKSCTKNSLSIFLKETVRAKKFHNTPSFPSTGGDYLSFVREENTSEEIASDSNNENANEIDADEPVFAKKDIHSDEEQDES